MSRSFDGSRKRIADGARWLAHGVGSDFRIGIQPTPLVFERADGPYLYDVDGNRFIDHYLGMGPMILGHTPSAVADAVAEQVRTGILYAGQGDLEYEAARLVGEMVPCADLVRFGSSGSEVVQAALRIARAATGRMTVLKFEGHYHGWFDNVLWHTAAPGPGSAGQDPREEERLAVLPWNDSDAAVERIGRGDLAAVIMEPAMCNASCVPPRDGYLEAVRDACRAAGTVLIFDEVITGFRLGPGGAQERFGVTPDLATFGKAIANGFPVAALAGRGDLMELVGGGGKVVHAGTYNGQAVCMAATVATLNELRKPATYDAIRAAGTRLMDGIAREGLFVQGWPEVFWVAFGVDGPVTDLRTAMQADKPRYVSFAVALLERGVRVLERGAWFVSSVNTPDVVDEALDAVRGALA